MAGDRQKDAARAHLRALCGSGEDASLIAETLAGLRESVEQREPPVEGEASRIASAELRKMRAEKRAAGFVSSHRQG